MRLPAMSVCLSVSKITQKRVHGFGWNFACRQMSGHTNWSSFEPNPDYSPDAGTGKSESRRSVEVGQTGTSLSSGYTGQGMHCLLHVVVQGPGRFPDPVDFSVRRTVAELRASTCPIFGFWPLSECAPCTEWPSSSTSNNSKMVQYRAILTMADQ